MDQDPETKGSEPTLCMCLCVNVCGYLSQPGNISVSGSRLGHCYTQGQGRKRVTSKVFFFSCITLEKIDTNITKSLNVQIAAAHLAH